MYCKSNAIERSRFYSRLIKYQINFNIILLLNLKTKKSASTEINVIKLLTARDGGILDPDDLIQDVVEDKELVNSTYFPSLSPFSTASF